MDPEKYFIRFSMCFNQDISEQKFFKLASSFYQEAYNNFDQPIDISSLFENIFGKSDPQSFIHIESNEKIQSTQYITFEVMFYREESFCELWYFRPVIWNFMEGLKGFDNVIFLWKFKDGYLENWGESNLKIINDLEKKLQEVVSKIFYKRYSPERKNLTADIKSVSYAYDPKNDIVKYNGGNIFSSFLFSDYGKLTEIEDKINMKVFLQEIVEAEDFSSLQGQLQNRGIQGRDLDFLLSIIDDISIITEMRNLLAHNNGFFKSSIEKTRSFIGQFEKACTNLDNKIDNYRFPDWDIPWRNA